MAKKPPTEFIALETFVNEGAGMFYEEGGVYDHHPRHKWHEAARPLVPGERVVMCPRCGHRFAETTDCTAEANRDLHFDGDEDCPSICRDFRPRDLRLVAPLDELIGERQQP